MSAPELASTVCPPGGGATGLRIAMVCPYSFDEPGGVQSHVIGLAGWLTAAGHTVNVLAPGTPEPNWLAAHGLHPGQVTRASHAIPVRYNGSVARITFGPHTHSQVRRWLEMCDPQLIHVHEPITPSASVHAVWARTAPVIATYHTATPGSRTMRLAGQLMGETIAALEGGIAVSTAAREVVRRHIGLDPTVIGNGITVSAPLEQPNRQAWRGGQLPRITFLGRYDEPRKGFGVFRRAVTTVAQQRPVEVVVVGKGRPQNWHLPEPSTVSFTGRVDDATRDELLAQTDVYVAPHLGRESFGIVLLEALAAGARVVASDLAAFREVISDQQGPIGTVVAVGDAAGFADAILSSLDQPAPTARGYARATEFGWDRVGPQVVEQYMRTLASAEPGTLRSALSRIG